MSVSPHKERSGGMFNQYNNPEGQKKGDVCISPQDSSGLPSAKATSTTPTKIRPSTPHAPPNYGEKEKIYHLLQNKLKHLNNKRDTSKTRQPPQTTKQYKVSPKAIPGQQPVDLTNDERKKVLKIGIEQQNSMKYGISSTKNKKVIALSKRSSPRSFLGGVDKSRNHEEIGLESKSFVCPGASTNNKTSKSKPVRLFHRIIKNPTISTRPGSSKSRERESRERGAGNLIANTVNTSTAVSGNVTCINSINQCKPNTSAMRNILHWAKTKVTENESNMKRSSTLNKSQQNRQNLPPSKSPIPTRNINPVPLAKSDMRFKSPLYIERNTTQTSQAGKNISMSNQPGLKRGGLHSPGREMPPPPPPPGQTTLVAHPLPSAPNISSQKALQLNLSFMKKMSDKLKKVSSTKAMMLPKGGGLNTSSTSNGNTGGNMNNMNNMNMNILSGPHIQSYRSRNEDQFIYSSSKNLGANTNTTTGIGGGIGSTGNTGTSKKELSTSARGAPTTMPKSRYLTKSPLKLKVLKSTSTKKEGALRVNKHIFKQQPNNPLMTSGSKKELDEGKCIKTSIQTSDMDYSSYYKIAANYLNAGVDRDRRIINQSGMDHLETASNTHAGNNSYSIKESVDMRDIIDGIPPHTRTNSFIVSDSGTVIEKECENDYLFADFSSLNFLTQDP